MSDDTQLKPWTLVHPYGVPPWNVERSAWLHGHHDPRVAAEFCEGKGELLEKSKTEGRGGRFIVFHYNFPAYINDEAPQKGIGDKNGKMVECFGDVVLLPRHEASAENRPMWFLTTHGDHTEMDKILATNKTLPKEFLKHCFLIKDGAPLEEFLSLLDTSEDRRSDIDTSGKESSWEVEFHDRHWMAMRSVFHTFEKGSSPHPEYKQLVHQTLRTLLEKPHDRENGEKAIKEYVSTMTRNKARWDKPSMLAKDTTTENPFHRVHWDCVQAVFDDFYEIKQPSLSFQRTAHKALRELVSKPRDHDHAMNTMREFCDASLFLLKNGKQADCMNSSELLQEFVEEYTYNPSNVSKELVDNAQKEKSSPVLLPGEAPTAVSSSKADNKTNNKRRGR